MQFNRYLQLIVFCTLLFSALAYADRVEYAISGVDEPMLTNVRNNVTAFRIGSGARVNSRLRRRLTDDAITATADALRPYGYFNPTVEVEITPQETGNWLLSVNVEAGPPTLITDLHLELTGPGKDLDSLNTWYADFPLQQGQVLNQIRWDQAKLEVIGLLEEEGYLQAGFSRHEIRVDAPVNTARLELVVETGPQAVMGSVTFKQEIVNDGILSSLRRFEEGDAYHAFLLEKFRLDLWRSGFFEEIEVVERRVLTATPPRVDFEVNVTPRLKNTYQGTIGYGTDTKARFQLFYGRHLLSPRGDNFDLRLGWQQKDNQFSVQANYRLPRETETSQFWIASAGFRSEDQQLKISADEDIENRLDVARGSVEDYWLRLGKTRVRNIRSGFEQLFETIYVQYLHEKSDFRPIEFVNPLSHDITQPLDLDEFFKTNSNTLAIGMDWDWPQIRGSGFQTIGHRERAWVFTSNEAWGSDIDFTQVYLSSRWNFLATDRLKILLRAEAGYSNASNTSLTVPTEIGGIAVSATDLPNFYRFKAGGSQSVRGYAFESLDNNGLGSNNVLSASAEAEYLVHENWSVAAFVDTGNAFNDWSKPKLKLGTGVGVRWYSIIGALRLDVAQGWALEGNPWRIHISIGTNLL